MFKDNWTALISASKEGHLPIVEELLKCGAALEHRDMVCGSPRAVGWIRVHVTGRREVLYFVWEVI